jgi:hypothetical protein
MPRYRYFRNHVYRGVSFGDAFKVKEELNKPILFTEFGADAITLNNAEIKVRRTT